MRRLHAKRKMEVDKLRKEKARKSAPSKPAIEINPARNGGKNYHFTEVVRNKEARKHMHAHTCEGCAGYYEEDERSNLNHAANCKGSGSKGSSSKSKSTSSKKSKNHFLDERHRQMEARLQKTSRHRAQHKPDPEPPDYWQMGFPNTQRVEEINRRAEKDREEKRLYMEAQAQTDGFYRYRKD
ncbi:hypothetical protein BCR35DRAFT_305024 [Leucosporidium creatinivorum]|uniref:DNA endonuclease activator Ctp1 C-terminal domain-containing protein n=1 Tax=Leucosporidium creatinivorum TaxID=106004 RepID=A0A1Y2F3C8_9BASI|nr:hypothetical protein BCR35DRAFT_305024 [Leucosporidium creatinivorum]